MSGAFYLALRYLLHHRMRTIMLVASMALIALLPILVQVVASESDRLLRARAETTPLIAGARGSAADLVLNALYFLGDRPPDIPVSHSDALAETGLAAAVPVDSRFTARRVPVVGVDIDYVFQRRLAFADGRRFVRIGEAVIGSDAAARLDLKVGGTITTDPATIFDLAGSYPMRLDIVGVLAPTGGPDDTAILVDLTTSWAIAGHLHGHQDLAKTKDQSVILERRDDAIIANAKLPEFAQVTEQNRSKFHGHGKAADLPVTAVLLFPPTDRDAALLRGRFVDGFPDLQVREPARVVDRLLKTLFDIGAVLNGVIAIVALSTIMTIVLVFAITLRLRADEFATNHRLGGGRFMTMQLIIAELILLAGATAIVVAFGAVAANALARPLTAAILQTYL